MACVWLEASAEYYAPRKINVLKLFFVYVIPNNAKRFSISAQKLVSVEHKLLV